MTWGIGPWGLTPWGGVTAATPGGVLSVGAVLATYSDGGIALADVLGGEVIRVIGTGFEDPMVLEVLSGAGPYVVEGSCYIFDARYDVTGGKIYAGTPKLLAGTYHVRVTRTADGASAVITNALRYVPFADQLKVERVRVGLARVWSNGRRLLRGS